MPTGSYSFGFLCHMTSGQTDNMPTGSHSVGFLCHVTLGQISVVNTMITGSRERFLRRSNHSSFDSKELPFAQEVGDPRDLGEGRKGVVSRRYSTPVVSLTVSII